MFRLRTVPYEMIEDRGEAIKKAILETKEPTVILITGKGNETRQKNQIYYSFRRGIYQGIYRGVRPYPWLM